MKLIIGLIFSGIVFAQTATYPSVVVGDNHLKVGTNNFTTFLSAPVNSTATTLLLDSTTGLNANSLLTIGSSKEIVSTCAVAPGYVIIGTDGACPSASGRGFDGTLAVSHVALESVSGFITAWHTNALAAEIKAIESALGPNLNNVLNPPLSGEVPFAVSTDFNFTPRSPGGSLSIGVNVVTLTTCPFGVNGSNTKHYLYISGGTGAAEPVLITGGTCTSNAPSGTVIFTAANTHTGAWTVSSGTVGITEAAYTLPAGGGLVYVPEGTHQLRERIPFKENWAFRGAGASTKIVPASSSAIVFDSNLTVNPSSQVLTPQDGVEFSDFMIDGHIYDGINSVYGIRHIMAPASVEFSSIVGVKIQRIHFNNLLNGVYLERSADVTMRDTTSYGNTTFKFTDQTFDPVYRSYSVRSYNHRQWRRCYAADCAIMTLSAVPIFNFENCVSCSVVSGELTDLVGGLTGPDGIRFAGACEDSRIIDTTVIQFRIGVFMEGLAFAGFTHYPHYMTITGSHFDQPWLTAIQTPNGTATTDFFQGGDLTISNSQFTNIRTEAGAGVALINISDYFRSTSIINNSFLYVNSTPAQRAIALSGTSRDTTIVGNIFENLTAGAGVNSTAIWAGTAGAGFKAADNTCVNFGACVFDASVSVTAASTITLPWGRVAVDITGATAINTINACDATNNSQQVILRFYGVSTVNDGSNLKLNGNFTSAAFSTLTLACDGTQWLEMGRSVN